MNTPASEAFYGPTNPSPETQSNMNVRRYCSVIGLKADKEEYYRKLHADVWPSVLDRIRKSNMRNYSIHTTEIEGKKYLISYFEYVGQDFDSDMQAIADDPETQRWWKETDPCQRQLPNRKPGANWSETEMVFMVE
jgi:L-rhamnose mutarotase